jgi:hypothetical protein
VVDSNGNSSASQQATSKSRRGPLPVRFISSDASSYLYLDNHRPGPNCLSSAPSEGLDLEEQMEERDGGEAVYGSCSTFEPLSDQDESSCEEVNEWKYGVDVAGLKMNKGGHSYLIKLQDKAVVQGLHERWLRKDVRYALGTRDTCNCFHEEELRKAAKKAEEKREMEEEKKKSEEEEEEDEEEEGEGEKKEKESGQKSSSRSTASRTTSNSDSSGDGAGRSDYKKVYANAPYCYVSCDAPPTAAPTHRPSVKPRPSPSPPSPAPAHRHSSEKLSDGSSSTKRDGSSDKSSTKRDGSSDKSSTKRDGGSSAKSGKSGSSKGVEGGRRLLITPSFSPSSLSPGPAEPSAPTAAAEYGRILLTDPSPVFAHCKVARSMEEVRKPHSPYCCQDTFPDSLNNDLSVTCGADKQGSNRLQRGLLYMSYLKWFYTSPNSTYRSSRESGGVSVSGSDEYSGPVYVLIEGMQHDVAFFLQTDVMMQWAYSSFGGTDSEKDSVDSDVMGSASSTNVMTGADAMATDLAISAGEILWMLLGLVTAAAVVVAIAVVVKSQWSSSNQKQRTDQQKGLNSETISERTSLLHLV